MARAKETNRAEARRRYRQATSPTDIDLDQELDGDDEPDDASARPATKAAPRTASTAPARPSFFGSFRLAYHPANIREDLRALPKLLTSRALLFGLALVLGGTIVYLANPRMTGGTAAWDLLVVPSSALLPHLAVGFFAPRASYLLGFIVGLVQAGVYAAFLPTWAANYAALGYPLPPDFVGSATVSGLASGPFYAMLFAAGAAWYRRFLSITSPRRTAATRGQPARGGKQAPAKRASGR